MSGPQANAPGSGSYDVFSTNICGLPHIHSKKETFALSIERDGSFGGSSLEHRSPAGDSQERKVKFLMGVSLPFIL
jgi:hypothetical protein